MRRLKNTNEIIQQTSHFVQSKFESEGSGHDWWHIHRVRNMALFLYEKEGGDPFIIEIAALLHDLDDWKIKNTEPYETEKWLRNFDLSKKEIQKILKKNKTRSLNYDPDIRPKINYSF